MSLSNVFRDIIMIIFSIPKTIYINVKYLPFKQAIKFPICIAYNVKIEEKSKTKITICNDCIEVGMIRLGMSRGSFYKGGKSLFHLNGGEIFFKGKTAICGGFSLIINSGKLHVGDDFFSNANLLLNCSNEILIEDHVLVGWDCTILDDNGHQISTSKTSSRKKVIIGSHTWLSSGVAILNGSKLKNDTVVSFGSVVHEDFQKDHIIIAGNPAKIVRENIEWKR